MTFERSYPSSDLCRELSRLMTLRGNVPFFSFTDDFNIAENNVTFTSANAINSTACFTFYPINDNFVESTEQFSFVPFAANFRDTFGASDFSKRQVPENLPFVATIVDDESKQYGITGFSVKFRFHIWKLEV